jgi:hypothetical protein
MKKKKKDIVCTGYRYTGINTGKIFNNILIKGGRRRRMNENNLI